MAHTALRLLAAQDTKRYACIAQKPTASVQMLSIPICPSQARCAATALHRAFSHWNRTSMKLRTASIWPRWNSGRRIMCRRGIGIPLKEKKWMECGARNAISVPVACHSVLRRARQRLAGMNPLTVAMGNPCGEDGVWQLRCRAVELPVSNWEELQ